MTNAAPNKTLPMSSDAHDRLFANEIRARKASRLERRVRLMRLQLLTGAAATAASLALSLTSR